MDTALDVFPKLVVAVGHLVIPGREVEPPYKAWWTPSWLVVVVDIENPKKPVWLVRDVKYLGWKKKKRTPDDKNESEFMDDESGDEDDDGNIEGCELDELRPPPWSTRAETDAQKFFGELEKYSMIKIFERLEDWPNQSVDVAHVLSTLRDPTNCWEDVQPRLHFVKQDWI